MRKKQLLALAAAGVMTLAMAGCTSGGSTEAPATDAPEVTEDATTDDGGQDETGGDEATGEVSVDFEDDSISFVGVDTKVNPSADSSTLEVAEYNGSKALKVIPSSDGGVFIGIQADALLGSDASKLKTVELALAIESQGSEFAAVSGNIYGLVGEKNDQTSESWSIYLENQNPKTVSYTVPDDYSFGEGNYIVVSMESYAGDPANLYIDNIAFKDADGNVLSADSSAEFVKQSSGSDRMNLYGIEDAVEIEGFQGDSDGAWAQGAQVELTEDQLALLVPGAVIEISYSSESGNMWMVLPGAPQWQRIGDGTIAGGDGSTGYAYINGAKNVAQITYEQIAAVLGEDVSTWGNVLQCESDTAWEVYSVKIGKQAKGIAAINKTSLGMTSSDGAWAQGAQFELSEDQQALLVPGSVFEISYSSESGNLWMVFPGAPQWQRIGDGTIAGGDGSTGTAICDGSTAYVTYEMISAVLGDDVASWGNVIQCESDTAWEVYDVKIGTAAEIKPMNTFTEIEGFQGDSDGAWAQGAQVEISEDQQALLVPGSVIEVSYSSESGNIWLVFPGAPQWQRIGDGTIAGGDGSTGWAICSNGVAQIPYETISAVLGDDVATWGNVLQCESDTAWEVYSVKICSETK